MTPVPTRTEADMTPVPIGSLRVSFVGQGWTPAPLIEKWVVPVILDFVFFHVRTPADDIARPLQMAQRLSLINRTIKFQRDNLRRNR